jgi:hypothetical protein
MQKLSSHNILAYVLTLFTTCISLVLLLGLHAFTSYLDLVYH